MSHPDRRLDTPEFSQGPGITDLPIPGAWVFAPHVHPDERGSFHEWFRFEQFTEKLGHPFVPAQANLSRSRRGVVRGLHLADLPPGQAKLVTCVAGSVTDVLVDVRRGSPTFGHHVCIPLDASNAHAVYVPTGVGHGFVATSEDAVVTYLVSEAYNPEREFEINAFDPELGIDWGVGEADAQRSAKDVAAPGIADVHQRLPQWSEWRGWEEDLRRGWSLAMGEADAYDGEADAGGDTGPGAGLDAGPDAGPDAGLDGSPDAGTTVEPDGGPGTSGQRSRGSRR